MKAFMRGALVASALAFAFVNASDLQAATVITGEVPGGDQWGYVHYVHTGGDLSIDILASGWTGGINGEGIPDPYIEFYVDDGSSPGPFPAGLTGAFVGANDDSDLFFATGGDADGSTDTLDSFLHVLNLDPGNYILAIGHFDPDRTSEEDARDNEGANLPPRENGQWDYRVTFTSTPVVSEVPVPTALPLFVTGLAGLALLARRRKKRAA
jgi:hypothetical protein